MTSETRHVVLAALFSAPMLAWLFVSSSTEPKLHTAGGMILLLILCGTFATGLLVFGGIAPRWSWQKRLAVAVAPMLVLIGGGYMVMTAAWLRYAV